MYRADQSQHAVETGQRLHGSHPSGTGRLQSCVQYEPMSAGEFPQERQAKRTRLDQTYEADSSQLYDQSLTFAQDGNADSLSSWPLDGPHHNPGLQYTLDFNDQPQFSPFSGPSSSSISTGYPNGHGVYNAAVPTNTFSGPANTLGVPPSSNVSPFLYEVSGLNIPQNGEFLSVSGSMVRENDRLSLSNVAFNGSAYESDVDWTVQSPESSLRLDSSGFNGDYSCPNDVLAPARNQSLPASAEIILKNDEPWTTLNATFAVSELGFMPMPLAPSSRGVDNFHVDQRSQLSLSPPLLCFGIQSEGTFNNTVHNSAPLRGNWENSSISLGSDGYPEVILDKSTVETKKGRRSGPLDIKKRKKAFRVRNIGSCCQCRINKTPCSEKLGALCSCCEKMKISPWKGKLCTRARLRDYVPLLCPDIVTSRYSELSLTTARTRDMEKFTYNRIRVEMTSGSLYPPIILMVHEFVPKSRQLVNFRYVPYPENNCQQAFQSSYALPLGLDDGDLKSAKEELRKHIKSISNKPRDIGESTEGDIAMVSWKIYEAVNRYRIESKTFRKDYLLKQAVRLHTMQYFMARLTLLADSSTERAISKLQRPHVLPYNAQNPIQTSSLLNMQLKHEMLELLMQTTREVLQGLETALEKANRKKSTWASSFSVMVVICSALESVEMATDAMVTSKMRKNLPTEFSRIEYFRNLETVVFTHCTHLFHRAYHTHHTTGKGIFNPIRDGVGTIEQPNAGLMQKTADLVNTVRQILASYDEDISNRAKNLTFDSNPDLLTDHIQLRKKISGRLLSKFLRSFTDPKSL